MKKITFLFALLLLAILSCKKEKNADNNTTLNNENTKKSDNEFINLISQTYHVNPDVINYNSVDNTFIVDGDVLMTMAEVTLLKQNSSTKPDTTSGRPIKANHYYLGPSNLVSYTRAQDITINASFSPSSPWWEALDTAIKNWNATDNVVRFRRNGSSNDDIQMNALYTASTIVRGTGSFPLNGAPGNSVSLNNNLNHSFGEKVSIIMHELGHTIGFSHTDNDLFHTHITGTPDSSGDEFSIMQSAPGQPIFTIDDLKALDKLYPFQPNPVTSRVIPIRESQNVICTSGTATYTIVRPLGATILWSLSGSAATIPANSNGTSVTVTATGNGPVTLTATITGAKTYAVEPKPIQIGPPTVTWKVNGVPWSNSLQICGLITNIIEPISLGSTLSNITYRYNGTDIPLVEVSPNHYELPPDAFFVDVELTNSCSGTPVKKFKTFDKSSTCN